MNSSKDDKEFNATLRRLIKQKPKPHDEMKKGKKEHSPAANAPRGKK